MNIDKALNEVFGFGCREFIDKAIEGGYMSGYVLFQVEKVSYANLEDHFAIFRSKNKRLERKISVYQILLDPLAWRAVGKSEGWTEDEVVQKYRGFEHRMAPWQFAMHRFIDALNEQVNSDND